MVYESEIIAIAGTPFLSYAELARAPGEPDKTSRWLSRFWNLRELVRANRIRSTGKHLGDNEDVTSRASALEPKPTLNSDASPSDMVCAFVAGALCPIQSAAANSSGGSS